MEREVDINRLWKRLFGPQDDVDLSSLTDEEFENLVKFLENVKTRLEWQVDRASKRIIVWKPQEDIEAALQFLMLLGILKGWELKTVESRRANTDNSKNKE